NRTDVAKVRRYTRAVAVDAMAGRAVGLSVEERLALHDVAAGHVAGRAGAAGSGREAAQVRDDRPRLGFRKAARRHRRARDTGLDDPDDLRVGRPAPELAAHEIDAGHHVTGWTMTSRAARLIEPRAVLDVGRCVTVLLRQHRRSGQKHAGSVQKGTRREP